MLRSKVSVCALAIAMGSTGAAFAQDAAEEKREELRRMQTGAADAQDAANEEPTELRRIDPESDDEERVEDVITVTGSRIKGANPTSRVDVIGREELKAMAATNLQEVLDQLPQNLGNLNSLNSLDQASGGGTLLPDQGGLGSNINALGVSAANLGGIGVGSTLVLVDGRRQPGAAGVEDGFVNINNIPLASIERVEIIYNGASAVYGADAIGGVINIITRKDYQGWSFSADRDFGDADGDTENYSVYHGRNWDSGRFSVTGSYSKSNPLNVRDSGWTTTDYSDVVVAQDDNGNDIFGPSSFDTRIPGGLITTSGFFDPFAGGTIPSGFDFANATWTQDSFTPVTEADLGSDLPVFLGDERIQKSIAVNFEQDLTSDIRLFVSGSFTDTENTAPGAEGSMTVILPPSNFYGPSSQEKLDNIRTSSDGFLVRDYMTLDVFPKYAYDAGYLPLDTRSSDTETWSYSIGADWKLFDDKWLLEVDYTYGEENRDGLSQRLNVITSADLNFDFANRLAFYEGCSYDGGTGFGVRDSLNQIENQAAADAQCAALTSSDPNTAFNPWATSADDPGAITPDNVNNWYLPLFNEPTSSSNQQFTANLQGPVYQLPAGAIFASVGTEFRETETFSQAIIDQVGITPVNETKAFFGELSIPVFGGEFTRPGFHSLLLSLQTRFDEQTTEGAIGTVDNIPFEDGGEPIIQKGKAEATTTTLSFLWEPVKTLAVRGGWSQGFNPVNVSGQFDVDADTEELVSTIFSVAGDPFVVGADPDNPFPRYTGPSFNAPNPDLEPSESDTYNLGLTWTPENVLNGLRVSVNYRITEVTNAQIESLSLQQYVTPEEFYGNTTLFEREEFLREVPSFTGPGGPLTQTPNELNLITRQNRMTLNIPGRTTESIEYFVSYDFDTSFGDWRAELTYLDNLTSELEVAPGRTFSNLGFLSGNNDYRIQGILNYNYNNFSARLRGEYIPAYLNDDRLRVRDGNLRSDRFSYVQNVDESYYFDLTGAYQVSERLRVGGGVTNLLDADPPFTIVGDRPYDTGRYNPRGRVFSINATYEF